jgi:hypothetical protein
MVPFLVIVAIAHATPCKIIDVNVNGYPVSIETFSYLAYFQASNLHSFRVLSQIKLFSISKIKAHVHPS